MTDLLQTVAALAPPPAVWAVVRYLASVAGEKGCFPKQATIAKKQGLALRTVNWSIKWLKERGILLTKLRGRTSALYVPISTPVKIVEETQQLAFDFDAPLRSELRIGTSITLSEKDSSRSEAVPAVKRVERAFRSAIKAENEAEPTPKAPPERVEELKEVLQAFPRRFGLTEQALDALSGRLVRKAAYWKRGVEEVSRYLARRIKLCRDQPRSTAWFTTVVETHFSAENRRGVARSVPPPAPEVPKPPTEKAEAKAARIARDVARARERGESEEDIQCFLRACGVG